MSLFPSLRNRHGFFSDYYLGTVFGRATTRRRTLVTKEVDRAWRLLVRLHERAEGRAVDASFVRESFARPLLRDLLGFHLGAPKDRIHPLYSSAEDEAGGRYPIALGYVGAWDEDLDARRDGRQPAQHTLTSALARSSLDLRYGLLVTGERLRLVRRRGDGPRGAYLELDLLACLEDEDRESLAAAMRLLSADNFVPVDGRLPIDEVEQESREHAQRVSDDLKRAVFEAAETLVGAILETHRSGDADPPDDLGPYRDAALTFLYRLLFILYAEARDERLLSHPIYLASYSLDELVRDLLRASQPPAANRYSLWWRLQALFAIHGQGLPAIRGLEPIPGRGGDLFDPGSPAGRILEEVRLPDDAVSRVLRNLATTAPRRGVGLERVSFRELDIEQLGAVYEGLLEYEPRVARETTLEVRTQGRIFALPPGEVVRLCREKDLTLSGDPGLVEGTEAALLHPDPEGAEELDEEPDPEGASDEDEETDALKKGAKAVLLRRLEPGDFHFVPGPQRKGSGSFYTPLPLVQDLVRHALGPLVEDRTPAELEALTVLDPACGSAHFLVEAMRFLGRALHRAYVEEHDGKPPPGFRGTWDTDHEASDEKARAASSEARAWCKRRVAERCLHGVDLNPTAVNLAQVSLWIESLAGDRPLGYFRHHVRCGNSLLGTWLDHLDTPPLPEMRPKPKTGQLDIYANRIRQVVDEAVQIRALIDRAADVGAIEAESLEEQQFKDAQLRRAEETLRGAMLLFDLRCASAFVREIWAEWPTLCGLLEEPDELDRYVQRQPWWEAFEQVRQRERFFHWELEFPEVLLAVERRGFDAVLGNPPWDKILPNRHEFYGRHDVLIRAYTGSELDRRIEELEAADPALHAEFDRYRDRINTTAACLKKGGDYQYQEWEIDGEKTGGHQDAFKFFVERAHRLVGPGERVGFVVPSAIYNNEGCTGLRHLLLEQAEVERFYAFENRKKIFPIDSRYKFVSLVFRKGRPSGDGFPAAFMRHDLAELSDDGPKDFMVLVRRAELERLSPGTLAFLEYRSPRDREILLKMYGYDAEGNPVDPRPLLGDQGPGTWNARFYTEFNITNDRDLWTDPKIGKLWSPRQILGPVPGTTSEPPYYDPAAWPEIRARMAAAGFWPLYEGKHIEQFLVDIRPIERWVSLEACEQKYGRTPDPGPKLVFRDIARNTDGRTCIAAVLPEHSCAGDSLRGIAGEVPPDVMVSLLNSFPFDFAVRLRTAGTHLNFTYVERLAVPRPELRRSLPTVPTRSVAGEPTSHVGDLPDLWPAVWDASRAVAHAYGVTPADLEHILSTFPIFARKRPEFFAYFRSRIESVRTADEWRSGTRTSSASQGPRP